MKKLVIAGVLVVLSTAGFAAPVTTVKTSGGFLQQYHDIFEGAHGGSGSAGSGSSGSSSSGNGAGSSGAGGSGSSGGAGAGGGGNGGGGAGGGKGCGK